MAEENKNPEVEIDTDGVNEETINVESPNVEVSAFDKKEDIDLGYTDVSNQKTAKELQQEAKKEEPKEQQTEEDEFVLVDEDTDINENDEDDRSSGESLSGANNDENNTEDGYLTFGNIFSDKPDTKNAKPEDNVGKMSKIETHIGGGGGGLDAIIAAASVLDGK